MKAIHEHPATRTGRSDRDTRFLRDNKLLDRAQQIMDAHRGVLPELTWHEALQQARKESRKPRLTILPFFRTKV